MKKLLTVTGLLFLISMQSFAYDFKPIISCRNQGVETFVVTQHQQSPDRFQLVIKDPSLKGRFAKLLELYFEGEYITDASSPEYGVFIGEQRTTSLGRGINTSRLVVHYYEDTKSAVLVGDYSVNDGYSFSAFQRETLWGCIVNPKY